LVVLPLYGTETTDLCLHNLLWFITLSVPPHQTVLFLTWKCLKHKSKDFLCHYTQSRHNHYIEYLFGMSSMIFSILYMNSMFNCSVKSQHEGQAFCINFHFKEKKMQPKHSQSYCLLSLPKTPILLQLKFTTLLTL